jgi:sulfhydrogenase subunit beta (sulfur reductase)
MKAIKKEVFNRFINSLITKYEVIAPVKDGIVRFARITDARQITFDYTNTLYPPKRFFLPNFETLFRYNKNEFVSKASTKKRILFGIRPCDIHGLLVMDRFFSDEMEDTFYSNHRKNTYILGLNCTKGGEYCFCESLGTDTVSYGYDLLFTEQQNIFLVEVGSDRGKELAGSFKETKQSVTYKHLCEKRIDTAKLKKISGYYDSKTWEESSKKCLSCAACVLTCPTCGCFTVDDFPNFDIKSGSRQRTWSSCQQKDFSRVAGNFVFRDERAKRFKHRIYHKFDYYPSKFSEYMCIGCGRCIRNCPPRIDMVKIINEL